VQLDGLTALVTGGSRGIGRAACLALAREGADVVVHTHRDRTAAKAVVTEVTALGRRAMPVTADVTVSGEVEAMMAEVAGFAGGGEGLDILFNNAGVYPAGTLDSTTAEDWDHVMAVNCRGPFLVTKAAAPLLRTAAARRGNARVINIGSVIPGLGVPGLLAYAASKGAVVGFTHALSRELAPDGIRVNCVVPSMVGTETAVRDLPDAVDPVVASQSIPRLQMPDDLAGAVVFLASPASEFMTGQTMVVDGGRLLL
jgi:NAD(P)-dependent dehydrogenase (short-subunit alcohol dehydrogenase family)